ncbi:MAG: hypothetical protein DRR19_10590 [Candidatus Parabeggiatoa sp. nov. 1]|nr:MAG: hypothetical protein DRR19_10590 [Gammaproteobacteria bacterium]HEC83908.1 hypothetical protein [Thioploca sp.]
MKRNILRAAVAASLGLSGAAFAANVDVPFIGTVNNACTITNSSDGALVLTGTNTITSNPSDGGTRAIVSVACLGTGAISVASPVAGTGAAATLAVQSGYASSADVYNASTGGSVIANSSGTTSIGSTSSNYYPHMSASISGTIAPGTYNYTVAVTVTAE